MRYRLLQHLIEEVIVNQSCPLCSNAIDAGKVDIWALLEDRVVLSVFCSCSTSLNVFISERLSGATKEVFNTRGRPLQAITLDEFIAMRDSISDCSSGFSGLFEKKRTL
jgi:hypothetical protein